MEIFKKMMEIMKEEIVVTFADGNYITMNADGDFVRGKGSDNGVNWNNITVVSNEGILKICDEYSSEIEQYYNQLKGIQPQEEIKKAM